MRERGVAAVLAIAAVGGAGTMVVELAAVRLLAPWFGSSQVVWTNVIAVVLLALALGYALGGRLSVRGRAFPALGRTLLLAGVVTAWLPALSGVVARAFLPEGLALHDAADAVLWGSLATALVLFLPPAAVLGCVAPLAVETVQELEGGTAGHAGGLVLCTSTLGSLAGVFGTSHLLLPQLGLTTTYLAASGTLAAAGLAAVWLARRVPTGDAARPRGHAAALLLIPWGAALAQGASPRPALPDGFRELDHGESKYQSVRVVEEGTGSDAPLRYLQVNEAFDSYQSVWQERTGLLPQGFYYNDFALPAAWDAREAAEGAERPGDEWSVLVLGLGAGTALRVLDGTLSEGRSLRATGVELDRLVVRFAHEYMDLAPDQPGRRTLAGVDARVALNRAERYDQIILDCYANQVEIPAHLCTLEFFAEARSHLVEGGWLSVNLGGFGLDDPVVAAVARTCARAFEADVLLMRVPRSRNVSLVARRGAALPIAEGRLLAAAGEAGSLLPARGLPGAWRIAAATEDGLVLTDDRCPIEELQQRSIELGRRRKGARG